VTGDSPGNGFWQINVGVYISIRIEFAKFFKHSFAASHPY
jgi:hypothetical protein